VPSILVAPGNLLALTCFRVIPTVTFSQMTEPLSPWRQDYQREAKNKYIATNVPWKTCVYCEYKGLIVQVKM
jgi:hypothetical protein